LFVALKNIVKGFHPKEKREINDVENAYKRLPPFHLQSKLFFPSPCEGLEPVLKTVSCIFPRHHDYFPQHRVRREKEKEINNNESFTVVGLFITVTMLLLHPF